MHATPNIEQSMDCVVVGWLILIVATGCDSDTVKTSIKLIEKLLRPQNNYTWKHRPNTVLSPPLGILH
jgi:hypothetical protein